MSKESDRIQSFLIIDYNLFVIIPKVTNGEWTFYNINVHHNLILSKTDIKWLFMRIMAVYENDGFL